MYFALAGRSPVDAETLPAMLAKLMTEAPAPLAAVRPELPTTLAAAVSRSLAKDRTERFASADELAMALMEADRPRVARPEVRTFLRDATAGNVILYGGVGILALCGVFTAAGLIPRGAIGFVVTLGVGAIVLSAGSLSGGIMTLRRERVPWDEVDRAIKLECDDLVDQRNRYLKRSNVAARTAAWFGAWLIFAGAFAFVVGALLWRAKSFAVGAEPMTAGGCGAATGLALVLGSRSKRFRSWFVPGDAKRSIDDFALRCVQRLMRWSPLRRFYSRGVTTAPPSVPSALPTATLLLQRVEELVERLPSSMQVRLGDVLPAAAGLERAIKALRGQLSRFDQAMAELPPAHSARDEFARARERSAGRLEQSVSALEGIRTDLLRLGAGLIAADGITAELEKAQELSAAIDAELHGLDEVRRIVA
jgi:hypothetical protein